MKSLFAKKIYTGSSIKDNQVITACEGKIVSVEPGQPAGNMPVIESASAAFFDIQVNGGSKWNFTEKGNLEVLADINSSCTECGTGFTLPTIISSPLENILKGIDAVREYQRQYPDHGVLGLHLEGPFINPEKNGAHALSWIRKPTDQELEKILGYGKDIIKLITIAPEVFSDKQLSMLESSGITMSAGHSNATYEEAVNGFNHGIRLVTHLYNAMSAFLPRAPGLVGAAFDTSYVTTPLILDGHHCDFSSARIAYKLKRANFFLVSDALFVGKKRKHYQWGQFNAHLEGDKYINDEGHFAGSTISLGDAVRNAIRHVGISLPDAISMVTERPARAIGMGYSHGKIQPGYPAVFTVFDDSLTQFKIFRL